MSSLRSLLATMILCLISSCALGSISGLAGANALGSANVSYLWFRLYTVTLYSTQDTWSFAHPFGLELLYHRDISAADIVENTIDQIKKLGFRQENVLQQWREALLQIMPDVKKGATLTGVYDEKKETKLYMNNKFVGKISDPLFGQWFFSIWLGENTTHPNVRRSLLKK